MNFVKGLVAGSLVIASVLAIGCSSDSSGENTQQSGSDLTASSKAKAPSESGVTLGTPVPAAAAPVTTQNDELTALLASTTARSVHLEPKQINADSVGGTTFAIGGGQVLLVAFDVSVLGGSDATDDAAQRPLDFSFRLSDMQDFRRRVTTQTRGEINVSAGEHARVLLREVDGLTYCNFTGQKAGFLTEGRVLLSSSDGTSAETIVRLAVVTDALAADADIKLGFASEDCKWTRPATRTGCPAVNCLATFGTKWIGFDMTGVCFSGENILGNQKCLCDVW